jgi:hypothetical protein
VIVITSIAPLAVSAQVAELPRIEESDFFGNSAGSMGGGLMLFGAGTAESNCVICNRAVWGGGIAIFGGSASDSDVISNSASYGGGVLTFLGDVSGCSLIGNNADWIGGGIFAAPLSTPVTIVDCLMADNSAYGGGGMGLSEGTLAQACRVTHNRATLGGGVLCPFGGELRSSLVSQNSADAGGGVYCWAGANLVNDTITDNTASNAGGVLCVGAANSVGWPPAPPATVRNTILFSNSAANGANFLNLGTNVNYSHCCTYPALETGGIGNITNNPELTPCFRLACTSPCIDAGTNQNWMIGAVDLAGDPRIVNDIVDIGAFEFQGCIATNWAKAYTLTLDNPKDVQSLRQFRDTILKKDAKGNAYVAFLYQNTDQALALLMKSAELRKLAAKIVNANRDALEKALNGQVGAIRNPKDILAFCDRVGKEDKGDLGKMAATVKKMIETAARSGQPLFGLKFGTAD